MLDLLSKYNLKYNLLKAGNLYLTLIKIQFFQKVLEKLELKYILCFARKPLRKLKNIN